MRSLDEVVSALQGYADRGNPRGAATVLNAATSAAPTEESRPERRRLAVAVVVVVVIGVSAAVIATREPPSTVITDSPATTPGSSPAATAGSVVGSTPPTSHVARMSTDCAWDAKNLAIPSQETGPDALPGEIIKRQLATGWEQYSGAFALHPEQKTPEIKGWLRVCEIGPEPGKAYVYDAPDGVVTGYAYSQLGFVSLTDDASFDATARRTAAFGCDGFTDSTCNSRLRDQASKPAPGEPDLCTVTTIGTSITAASAGTGHIRLDLAVRNNGPVACSLRAGALIALYSAAGESVPFVVRSTSPVSFAGIAPNTAATFALDKYRCDKGDTTRAATIELDVGGQRVRTPLPEQVDLSWCGPGDPGSTIQVTFQP